MNYLILFLIIVLTLEIIIKTNFFDLIKSLLKFTQKAVGIILNKNISDNWKEKIIPKYSLIMMRLSFSLLIILLIIISLIFIAGLLFKDFAFLIFSLQGIIASILFAFGYSYFKKFSKK